MPDSNITLVVTSCQRHDLLKTTLETLYRNTDIEPRELIVVEDSEAPMPGFLADPVWRDRGLRWISNGVRIGQIASIDRAYAEVKTDFIFHCEDDWSFNLPGDWMRQSKEILDRHPEIIQVSLRGHTGWHDLVSDAQYPFFIAEPYWREGWGGISFNPGLRRLSDYRKLGSYGRHVSYGTAGLGHELALSKKLLDEGRRIADLGEPIVSHMGGTCSMANQPLQPMPRLLIAIPACFRLDYGAWESGDSPLYDQMRAWGNKPYGMGIHLSRENCRADAIRDTWAKDIAAYPFVTFRFFYGKPAGGYPRAALPDEVFLDVPDDYEHLPHKTHGIARWALEHEYDFLYKGDDDTAVYVDRLVRELLTNRIEYAGYVSGSNCAGGVGYFLSRHAFQIVATHGNSPDHWAEDVWVGKVLSGCGIQPLHLEGHKPGFEAHWYFGAEFRPDKLTSDTVTLHALQPEVLRDWYRHKESYV